MRNEIVITGANGFLGGKIIKELLIHTDYDIVAVVNRIDTVQFMLERENLTEYFERVKALSKQNFLSDYHLDKVSGAIHLAFSRRTKSNEEIADSIQYSKQVFTVLKEWNIENIIYCSSQGVYGMTSDIRTEDTCIAPASIYAMAKYAVEEIFDSILSDCKNKTIIRLESVIQSQNLVKALCKQARENGVIELKGGKQIFSYIDGDDVGSAFLALFTHIGEWKPIYNVGPNKCRYTLVEIAELVSKICVNKKLVKPEIHLEEQPIELFAGMDSSKFIEDTGWHPRYDIEQMIERIFNM